MGWLQSAGREILRWYLRAFPMRNGKTALYERFNEYLAPAERYVIVELPAGFRMKLDLRDTPQRKIFFYGTYDERHEAGMVRLVLEKHEVFWDIGANVGFYSLLAAALLQNNCQVVAFEPGKIPGLVARRSLRFRFDHLFSPQRRGWRAHLDRRIIRVLAAYTLPPKLPRLQVRHSVQI